jgi:hypothetical protein
MSGENFEALLRQLLFLLKRLVGIASSAYPDSAYSSVFYLLLQQVWSVDLRVDELRPFLPVDREPLYEPCVAVRAAVFAAKLGVDSVIENLGLGQDGSWMNLFDDHFGQSFYACLDLV